MTTGQTGLATAIAGFTTPAAIASARVFAEGIAEFVGVDASPFAISLVSGGSSAAGGISPFVTQVPGSDPYRVYVVFPSTMKGGDKVKFNIAGIDWSRDLLASYTEGGVKYDGDRINQVIPGADLVPGAGDELGGPILPGGATPPPMAAGQRYLAIYEQNPDGGSLLALSPGAATGVSIPAIRPVTSIPAAGQIAGEAILNTTNGLSYVWDGNRWNAIVPPSIVPYPTDADVWADAIAQPGVYAFSQATGNLFVRFNNGANDVWRQIGIRHFTDIVQLQAAAVVDGSFAYVQNNNTFWVYKNSSWHIISVYQDTEAAILAADASEYNGAIAVAVDTGKLFISDGAGWIGQPFRDYATEVALLAATPPDGTMAVAKDTGMVFYYTGGNWKAINRYATPKGTTDPAAAASVEGDLFYNSTDKVAKVYDGAGWQNLGAPSQWAIGSIQQSILTHAQFTAALPATERGKWMIATGQDSTGTALAIATGQNKLPDLRAAYLRMAGQNASNSAWKGGSLGDWQEDNTARPKQQFITNDTGNHYHSLGTYDQERHQFMQQYHSFTASNPSPLMKGKMKGEDANLAGTAEGTSNELETATSTDGQHMHAISGGGDAETRPKTYVVNYFIKVDH